MANNNNILSLIDIVTALFYQSQKGMDDGVDFELKSFLSRIKVSSATIETTEDAAIEALKFTCEWMLDNYTRTKFTKSTILKRFKVNLIGTNEYLDIVEDDLIDGLEGEELENKIDEVLSSIRHLFKRNKLQDAIKKMNSRLNFSSEEINESDFIKQSISDLEGMMITKDDVLAGHHGSMNFSNLDEVRAVVNNTKKLSSKEGLIKTGLQGLDRMFGGGVSRGYLFDVHALTHNYKSGLLMDLALNIPVYNAPVMLNPDKVPLINLITLENTLEQNTRLMYRKLHQLKHGEKLEIEDIDVDEATLLLKEHFESRGYCFAMDYFDPNECDVYTIQSLTRRYERDGYEIHAQIIDYLKLISENTPGDRPDMRILKTLHIARSFNNARGITTFTACQLSTEAKKLAREKPTNFTKLVAPGGFTEDCVGYSTKLDAGVCCHIYNHDNGVKYLMFSWVKHRGGEDTPESHKFFVQPFEEIGGIVPDGGVDDAPRYLASLPKSIDYIQPGDSDLF